MEPYGTTYFCEDIRQEASGQLTFVGIFPGQIVLPQVPLIIPKLGIITRVNFPWGNSVGDITWKIFFPGDPDDSPGFQAQLDTKETFAEQLKQMSSVELEGDLQKSHNIQQQIVLSPVQIKQEGFIRVRVYAGDKVVKAGATSIAVVPPQNDS